MRLVAAGFLAGVHLLQQQAELPAPLILGAAMLVATAAHAAALAWCANRGTNAVVPARALLLVLLAAVHGFGWAGLRAQWRLADALPAALEGVDVTVTGHIAGLPQAGEGGWRFVFDAEANPAGVPSHLQLSWRPDPRGSAGIAPILAGERWQFVVRLKRPHGLANPHGFDLEASLLERNIRATGYVRHAVARLDPGPATLQHAIDRMRARVRDRILAALPEAPYAGLLAALAMGDQGAISLAHWEIFRRTGLAHLVSISGLHIALVGTLFGGALGLAWRRIPLLCLHLPAQKAAALGGFAGGTVYALLAGMSIPVMRAWLMLTVVVLVMLSARTIPASRALALVLVMVLAHDPWALATAGFWLSFGAVAVILLAIAGRLRPAAGWRAGLRVQMAITVALTPPLLALFQSFPLVSPLANLVAIPLVSFIVTPLVLLGVVVPHPWVLWPAHAATALMMAWASWLSDLGMALWEQAAPAPLLLAASLTGVVLLLLPRATPGRLAVPGVLMALLLGAPQRPPHGAFRAVILDVGQGLAVHVQTRSHDLLFDAGPPYGSAADAGARVILPFLRAQGVQRLDRVVFSHEDIDHVGGAASLLRGIAVGSVLAGEAGHSVRWGDARAPGTPVTHCQAGQAWQWDGVDFEVLHPFAEHAPIPAEGNDSSCVLRVAGPGGAVLLAGDVEAPGEARMLARHPAARLAADVVVSAHHGSRSSSSAAFVDALLPAHVIHSAGHRNSFGHPHAQVWARWAEAGARNWRTDSQGAIEVRIAANADDGVDIRAWRGEAARYWHGR